MKIAFYSLLAAFSALLLWSNCTKSTPFGAELLEDQVADYAYTDTVTVHFTVEKEDSIVTSDRRSTADYFLCGQIADPIFGKSKAEVYSLIEFSQFSPPFVGKPTAQVDSIVMYLMLESGAIYGDTTQRQTVKILRLDPGQEIDPDSAYTSRQTFPANEVLATGEMKIFPARRDSLFYGTKGKPDYETLGAANWARIALPNSFGQELMGYDSLTYTNDTLFWEKIRGLKIALETPDPRAIAAFDLNNTTFSRITLFFKLTNDTLSRRFHYFFTGGNKFTHFEHDYAGSEAEKSLGKTDHDFIFGQGMTGLKVRIDFPFANNFNDIAVNKAELELTAAVLDGDNATWYPPARQFILSDTSRTLIRDVQYSIGVTQTGGFTRFGGYPEKETDAGQTVQRYRLQLADRFQDMVDQKTGDLKSTTIYLNAFPQIGLAGRSVFYGPKHGTFPAKLNLKYTKVK